MAELAQRSGLTVTYITELEEGRKKNPSPRAVRALAGALDEMPLRLKIRAGLVEFWDLYPVDVAARPPGYSLSDLRNGEENQLLWFLHYLRTSGPR